MIVYEVCVLLYVLNASKDVKILSNDTTKKQTKKKYE